MSDYPQKYPPDRKSKSKKSNIIKKLERKTSRRYEKEKSKVYRSFVGYDGYADLPRFGNNNNNNNITNNDLPPNYFASTEWREPVDVDGATTTEVLIENNNLSSLAVHDLYWQSTNVETDGKPKGFLHLFQDDISDGKPRGFLSFLEEDLPNEPKENINIISHIPSHSILHFLENLSNRAKKNKISNNSISKLDVDDFDVPNENKISHATPRHSFIYRLGGILPNINIKEPLETKKEPIENDKHIIDNKNDIVNKNPLYPSLDSSIVQLEKEKIDIDNMDLGRDWNGEFQYLLERLFESEDNLKKMRDLCKSFAKVAKEIGTIIISELFCKPEDRTIPPVTESIGGVAGGEKYVYKPERIFFKFAVDQQGIYGGTEYIMKASGHELNALMELMDCRVQGLHFPLMVLVDYRGYRLIAMPLLPIGYDTLVYGSADGGRNIYSISCEFNARMQLIGSILNLAGHDVWNLDHTEKTTIVGPVDIEGHLGRDDRFYILDTARLFPPAIPVVGLRGCHLYRLLRPELVKNNPVPLCSDAYSTWDIEGIVDYNQDIADATEYLEQTVIPEFGNALQVWLTKRDDFDICNVLEYTKFKIAMHRRGINMRCAGLVRQYTRDNLLQQFILTEIVARVAKKILFGRMRQLQTSEEYAIKCLIIDYFNVLFDNTKTAEQYWCIGIKNSLLKRFSNSFYIFERSPDYDLRKSISIKALFLRLQDICSIQLADDCIDEIVEYDPDIQVEYSHGNLFSPDDIIGIYAAERSIHQIDFVEGTMLSYKAVQTSEDGADELFALADERFQATIERKPDDYRALHNWALSLLYRANRKQDLDIANELYEKAYKCVSASIILNKDNGSAYLLWGNILTEQALRYNDINITTKLFKEATEKYTESYRCDPKSFELCYNWGNTLLYLANTIQENNKQYYVLLACEKYEKAIEINPISSNAYLNWGIALSILAKLENNPEESDNLYIKVEEKFVKSIETVQSDDSEILINWGNINYEHAQLLASRKDYKRTYKKLVKAGDKFMRAVKCGTGYNYDALINWGKVIVLQTKLNPEDKPRTYTLSFMVELYLTIFTVAVINEENTTTLSLYSIIELIKSNNVEISRLAKACLYRLAETHIPSLKIEVNRAIEILKEQNIISFSSENNMIINEDYKTFLKPKDIQEFTSFFQKIEATRTSMLRTNSKDDMLPLSDFQRLSDKSTSKICYTVYRKGTSELYVLKIRYENTNRSSSFNNISQTSETIINNNLLYERMTSIIKGHMPFLSRVMYSYRRDNNYYFIEEFISEDRSLAKLRQTGKFKIEKKDYLDRTCSLSEIKALDIEGVEEKSHQSDIKSKYSKSQRTDLKTKNRKIKYKSENSKERGIGKDIKKDVKRELKYKSLSVKPLLTRASLPESIAKFYIAEIIIAFSYLHSLGFIYGNLTPTTIYIDYNGHICLTKFYHYLENTVTLQDEITTTAPEVLCGGYYKREADWWSVGIILHEFLTGRIPKSNKFKNTLLSAASSSLISKLLRTNPKKRIGHNGVVEIKDHEFFKGFNWENAENMTLAPPIQFKNDITSLTIDDDSDDNNKEKKNKQRIAKLQDSGFHQNTMVTIPKQPQSARALHSSKSTESKLDKLDIL